MRIVLHCKKYYHNVDLPPFTESTVEGNGGMPDSETLITGSIAKANSGIYSRNFEQEGRTVEGNEHTVALSHFNMKACAVGTLIPF